MRGTCNRSMLAANSVGRFCSQHSALRMRYSGTVCREGTSRGPGSLQGVDPGSPDRHPDRSSPFGVCCQRPKHFRFLKCRQPPAGGVLCASLGDFEMGQKKKNTYPPIEYMTSTGKRRGMGKSEAQRAAVRLESLPPTRQCVWVWGVGEPAFGATTLLDTTTLPHPSRTENTAGWQHADSLERGRQLWDSPALLSRFILALVRFWLLLVRACGRNG